MTTYFLKLGGSLITEKRQAETPRLDVIQRLAQEISAVRQAAPTLRLVIGHGSGSFGHVYGKRYGTRQGVHAAADWYGFAATADAAARLNRIVTGALLAAGLPAWSIQPSVTLRCVDGAITAAPGETVAHALDCGLIPVVFGDVAFDSVRGGTIASTEEIFASLAAQLTPERLVLAGEVDGVYSADPNVDPHAERIAALTNATYAQTRASVGDSHGVDVTGGMAAKVEEALAMVTAQPGMEIIICSGLLPGNLQTALLQPVGTVGTRIFAG